MQAMGRRCMRLCAAHVACLLVLAGTTLGQAADQTGHAGTNPPWNRGLKILYAGRPGSEREKDFVGFLRQYFDVVRTGNLETFQEADTQGFDVTLLDWDWNAFEGPRPQISESFSRPIITLGVAGGMMCNAWRLKTGYL